MSWLSEQLHDIEKHVIRPVVKSDVGKAALIAAGVLVAGPAVLPVLGAAAGTVASVAGSAAGTLVTGAGGLLAAAPAIAKAAAPIVAVGSQVMGMKAGQEVAAAQIDVLKAQEAQLMASGQETAQIESDMNRLWSSLANLLSSKQIAPAETAPVYLPAPATTATDYTPLIALGLLVLLIFGRKGKLL